jgi:hypothetical protein
MMPSKFSALWTKLLAFFALLAIITPIRCEELQTTVRGFAYTTVFSDNRWFDNKSSIAINLDADYGPFAVRTQVATETNAVRRLVGEYSFIVPWINMTSVWQVGRYVRLDSFYNNVTDSPGTSGMAILPMAGYNRRMATGTFTIMDGWQTWNSVVVGETLVTARYGYGKMMIESQRDLHKEVFSGKIVKGLDLESAEGVYDFGLHLEHHNWHAYYSHNYYKINTKVTEPSNPMANFVNRTYSSVDYPVDKIGLKYFCKKYWVQGEMAKGTTYSTNYRGVKKHELGATDYNVIAGYAFKESYAAYIGQSRGFNDQGRTAKDRFIGVTYDNGKWAASLEYHKGEGLAWRKYDSPIDSWNAFVTSVTYRF